MGRKFDGNYTAMSEKCLRWWACFELNVCYIGVMMIFSFEDIN